MKLSTAQRPTIRDVNVIEARILCEWKRCYEIVEEVSDSETDCVKGVKDKYICKSLVTGIYVSIRSSI